MEACSGKVAVAFAQTLDNRALCCSLDQESQVPAALECRKRQSNSRFWLSSNDGRDPATSLVKHSTVGKQ